MAFFAAIVLLPSLFMIVHNLERIANALERRNLANPPEKKP